MDTENTPVDEVDPQETETQSEQVTTTDEVEQSPPETAEDKDEEMIPVSRYKELQSKFTRTAQENAELRKFYEQNQEAETAYPDLDPESAKAVLKLVREEQRKAATKAEVEKAKRFAEKHAEELQDPVLSGTVMRLISEAQASGNYLDQEDALSQAKQLLDARIKPQAEKAKKEGLVQGTDLAQKRAELGKVGDTPTSQKLDPNELTADEYAKYFNLPRAK